MAYFLGHPVAGRTC